MRGYDKLAMPKSPQSTSKVPSRSGKASRQTSLLQGKIYIIRVVFSIMALLLLAVNDAYCHGRPGYHVWLLLGGMLYPHLGQMLLGRFDIRRRRGHAIFLIDGIFVGAIIAALEFSMLSSTVLAVISLFNWMVVGGSILIALGLTFMVAGMLTAGAVYPVVLAGAGSACNASDWLAISILLGYFLIVARIIHQLVGELRLQQAEFQGRADSASMAKNLVERAMLMVLPASAARVLAEQGELNPETIQDATLLLVEFVSHDNHTVLSLDEMKDILHVCEMIMARHGIELVKTFGRRAITMSRNESGPDDAIRAMKEIDSFFTDGGSLAGAANAHHAIRGVLHHGPVTLGLVQPERLNLDLLGSTVDELMELATLAADGSAAGLIVSPAAYRKLRNPADFAASQSGGGVPSCYLYAPGSPS